MTEPTPGRVVLYVVSRSDLDCIREQLGNRGTIVEAANTEPSEPAFLNWEGNAVKVGESLPFEIVKTWHQPGQYSPGVSCVNGKLTLDGPGPAIWLTSRSEGTTEGTWRWPVITPAPAASSSSK